MRRNYRAKNGSSYRNNDDNDIVDKKENVADIGRDIFCNIQEQVIGQDNKQEIEQDKEMKQHIESDITEPEITEDSRIDFEQTTSEQTKLNNKTTMEDDLEKPMKDNFKDKVDKMEKEDKMEHDDILEHEEQENCLLDIERDIIIINRERYEILANEHEYIFHPECFGISPTWVSDSNFQYKCLFELKDNQLYLKSFQVTSDRGYPDINQIKPEICSFNQGLETVQYSNVNEPLKYSGAIMFANSLIKDYRKPNHMDLHNPLCFSFKFVGELIFDEGKLITSVNHNRAMRRIRKNIDLGLRSLDKKQDINCIKKFIKASFIGDYQPQGKVYKRKWKENLMNKNMRNKEVHMMESNKKRYINKIRLHLKKFGSK